MGLRKSIFAFLQLLVLISRLSVDLLLSLSLECLCTLLRLFLVPVPAVLQSRGSALMMERIRKFFSRRDIWEGEKGDRLYQVPVYQREDGATVKLGSPVSREGGKVYHVKNILVRADLEKVHVVLVPLEVTRDKNLEQAEEEMMVEVGEVEISTEGSINVSLARDSMQTVAQTAAITPRHVQKFVRKHQLSVSMRKEVQRFLAGFSMSGSASLGCVNWQLDPAILGLERETDFSLEHRIERAVDIRTQLDLLMGRGWDVKRICGSEGYRVILTVEILVDCGQELLIKMHATLVTGRLDMAQYRAVCLRDTSGLHMICNRRLSDITNNRTRRLSDVTPGQTLAWDEFQTQSAGNSPYRPPSGGVPSVTVSLDDMFASGNLPSNFPAASTTTFQTLEKLLSALPQSQIVFNSPIKEVSGENTGLGSSVGPNTSTPADDLEGGEPSHLTPHSSPSLQERQDRDEEVESLNLQRSKLAERVTFEELIPTSVTPLQRMNISPDLEDHSQEEEEEAGPQGEFDMESDDGSYSAKPSPNISTDLEEMNSPRRKSSSSLHTDQGLVNKNNFKMPLQDKTNTFTRPSPPAKTAISRVQEYIQSLPSPQHFLKRESTRLGEGAQRDLKSIQALNDEDVNNSICSGSHSIISRQSDLASLNGARMGSGMFYGGPPVSAAVCPFPDDWQQTIPEVIENDDEVD